MALTAVLLSLVVACIAVFGSTLVQSSQQFFAAPEQAVSHSFQKSWSYFSPYHASGKYTVPPDGCSINQVNILQRHGVRPPTSFQREQMGSVVKKMKAAKEYKSENLQFLRNYTFGLKSGGLMPIGGYQSYESGQEAFERYSNLLDVTKMPFVRVAGSSRVVHSASNWTAAVTAASKGRFFVDISQILPEGPMNTISSARCAEFSRSGIDRAKLKWWLASSSSAIIARLEKDAPGTKPLEHEELLTLMSLCPFDSMATGNHSPFCDIFTPEEFNGLYQYTNDLEKFYGTGYGNQQGPVQGVGYVNELIARLTGEPVSNLTQTAYNSPSMFPVDRSIYADFSHGSLMTAVFSAIGLFRQAEPLDPASPNTNRTWFASQIIPFSGRLVTERLDCGGHAYVRMMVNDAVQPLEFCGADVDGLCTLEKFVESQSYSRNNGEGDLDKCFLTQ